MCHLAALTFGQLIQCALSPHVSYPQEADSWQHGHGADQDPVKLCCQRLTISFEECEEAHCINCRIHNGSGTRYECCMQWPLPFHAPLTIVIRNEWSVSQLWHARNQKPEPDTSRKLSNNRATCLGTSRTWVLSNKGTPRACECGRMWRGTSVQCFGVSETGGGNRRGGTARHRSVAVAAAAVMAHYDVGDGTGQCSSSSCGQERTLDLHEC